MKSEHIYMARVFLSQARHFRRHSNYHALLLIWAANRRRLAMAYQPDQPDLFT